MKLAIRVACDYTTEGDLVGREDILCSSITESPIERDSGHLGAKSFDSFHRNLRHVKPLRETNKRLQENLMKNIWRN